MAHELSQIGQFSIRSRIDNGPHAGCYLAHDGAMDRYVALRLVSPDAGVDLNALLAKFRALARLQHPNIVQIHDVGVFERKLYIASEFVSGRTLRQVMTQQFALNTGSACQIICGVLSALDAAHRAGVLHENLEPQNILVESDGTPKLADFCNSPKVTLADGRTLDGSLAYMAPEYLHSGEKTARYDLHAAGLILFEMLTGQAPYAADGAEASVERLLHHPPECPAKVSAALGDKMTHLLHRAVSKTPEQRFVSAGDMRRLLEMELSRLAAQAAADRAKMGRLEELLSIIGQQSDFPSLGNAVADIQKLGDGGAESVDVKALPDTIRNDFALTNNLLRLANSAYYSRRASEPVTTVSRAVVLLGFKAVRDMSLSLLLLNQLKDQGRAEQLKHEYLRLNLCAATAQELSQRQEEDLGEEAFVAGLFHNLGRLLCCYCFPEQYDEIEVAAGEGRHASECAAEVLGVSYEELGFGAAESWGMAEELVSSIRHVSDPRSQPHGTPPNRLSLITSCASELAEQLEQGDAGAVEAGLQSISDRFGVSLGLSHEQISESADKAQERMQEMVSVLDLDVAGTRLGRKLAEARSPSGASDSGARPYSSPDKELKAAIAAAESAIQSGEPLADILEQAIRRIFDGLQCDQALLAQLDEAGKFVRGKHGASRRSPSTHQKFQFEFASTGHLFNASLARNVDLMIQDAGSEKVQKNLPHWFADTFHCQSFLFLPIRSARGTPLGAIFARWEDTQTALRDPTIESLRTLRNLLAMAISSRR